MESVQVLLIGGDHNFEELAPILKRSLERQEHVSVTVSTNWDELRAGNVSDYDVVVDYLVDYHGEMTDEQRSGLLSFVRDGGGYVGLHGAAAMFGAEKGGEDALLDEQKRMLRGRFVDHADISDVKTEIIDSTHPITAELADFSLVDEPYELEYREQEIRVLAQTHHESFGQMPVAWTTSYGDGRVFYYSAGHDKQAFQDPHFQQLVRRGVEWAAKLL